MKKLNEKRTAFSVETFRPTENQKTVLNQINDITTADRKATKGDVAKDSNLEEAFDILVKLGLIAVDENDEATLTENGQAVVGEMGKEAPANDMAGGEEPMNEPDMPGLSDEEEKPPMESLKFFKEINLLTEAPNRFNFSKDELDLFTKALKDDKFAEMIFDDSKLLGKLEDYASEKFASEIPYGTITGDDATMDEWVSDNLEMVLTAATRNH